MVYAEFKVRKGKVVKETNIPNLVLNNRLCTRLECINKLITGKIKLNLKQPSKCLIYTAIIKIFTVQRKMFWGNIETTYNFFLCLKKI